MKHLFILTLLLMSIGARAADTATVCVETDTPNGCDGVGGATSDWEIYCPIWKAAGGLDHFLTRKGIGVCASESGSSGTATENAPEVSTALSDNYHCWCKMTHPAVSKWMYLQQYTGALDGRTPAQMCAEDCGGRCGYSFANLPNIGFSNLSER